MIDDKVLDRSLALVQALHRRTRDGKIDWRESRSPTAFETDTGEFVLRIRRISDASYPDEPDFALDIIDRESNRFIETISNVTLRPVSDQTTDEGLNPYALLEETYEMARRKVLRVEDVLERVLESVLRQ